MAKVDLFPDFKELFKSLDSNRVKYLLLGGHAVIYYGYARTTSDLDVWIAVDPRRKVVRWDGIRIPLISLADLRINQAASARPKDLADLENLPSGT